jgi:hypothetical protein
MTSIKTLADKALLFQVNISCFTGAKKDKQATRQVIDDNNVSKSENNVRVWKNLMKGTALNKVTSCAQKIRLNSYRLTAPWGEGIRICKVDQFQKIKMELEKNIREFYVAVDEAVADYQNMIDADRVKLGNLYNPSDYPSKAAFASSFSAKINVAQVEKSDFRNQVLSNEDIEEINNQIAERIKNNAVEVEKDLVGRVSEKLGHLLSRLTTDGKFHSAAIDNVIEAVNEARALNIADNQKLDNLFDKIEESMGTLSAEQIREFNSAKSTAIIETKQCIEKVSDMMSEFMV